MNSLKMFFFFANLYNRAYNPDCFLREGVGGGIN